MTLRLSTELLTLRTRHPFIIARGGQSEYRTVMVRITDGDGVEGWGEAAATRFYGETLDTVLGMAGRYQVPVFVATRGQLARRVIRERRPRAVVAARGGGCRPGTRRTR